VCFYFYILDVEVCVKIFEKANNGSPHRFVVEYISNVFNINNLNQNTFLVDDQLLFNKKDVPRNFQGQSNDFFNLPPPPNYIEDLRESNESPFILPPPPENLTGGKNISVRTSIKNTVVPPDAVDLISEDDDDDNEIITPPPKEKKKLIMPFPIPVRKTIPIMTRDEEIKANYRCQITFKVFFFCYPKLFIVYEISCSG
jgi:hypothetical protein